MCVDTNVSMSVYVCVMHKYTYVCVSSGHEEH
jgi:hypothetical protein